MDEALRVALAITHSPSEWRTSDWCLENQRHQLSELSGRGRQMRRLGAAA